ncbi:hypothetical protein [Paraburkholderia unamae]|uniref:Uncharacterized protein n=1 Tax=Paraburkholderia unamae TaxID=219649 RepID=A0ACC6RX28_9BURK
MLTRRRHRLTAPFVAAARAWLSESVFRVMTKTLVTAEVRQDQRYDRVAAHVWEPDKGLDDRFFRRFSFTRDVILVFFQFLVIALMALLVNGLASAMVHLGLLPAGSFLLTVFRIAAGAMLALDMILFVFLLVRASLRVLGPLK